MTLQKLMEHFFYVYGKRNRLFFNSLSDRINFFNLSVGDLQEAVRKDFEKQKIEIACARVMARIFCIAEHFEDLPLVLTMTEKYPGHCTYCHQLPCRCDEVRPDFVLEESRDDQMFWSLTEWCNHFEALYGEKNRGMGFENTLNRLFKEVTELLSLSMNINNFEGTIEEIEKEFALELADCLAWVIASVNLLNVDLERATLERFGNGCWKCEKTPCICTRFNVTPVKWRLVREGLKAGEVK